MRPQLREIHNTSAIVLLSSLFLLVFLIHRQGLDFSVMSIILGRLITRGDVVLRLRGLERAVLKPDRFVCRLRPNQLTKNLSEDREPLSTSSGNQSFRCTVRFILPLVNFVLCSSYRPQKSPKKKFFPPPITTCLAFAYFNFRVCSVEFVSWSRSCYWLGLVTVQFVCFFPLFPSISSHHRKFFPLPDRFVL